MLEIKLLLFMVNINQTLVLRINSKNVLLVRWWRGILPCFPGLPSQRLHFIVVDTRRPRRSQHCFLLLITNRNGLSDKFFTRRPASKALVSNFYPRSRFFVHLMKVLSNLALCLHSSTDWYSVRPE